MTVPAEPVNVIDGIADTPVLPKATVFTDSCPVIPTPPATIKAPVDVFVDAVPEVIAIPPAVSLLSPTVMPEPVNNCVEPTELLDRTVARNLVAVEEETFINADDEAVPDKDPLNVVAVIVLPKALIPDNK
jgi:hypothetical protein